MNKKEHISLGAVHTHTHTHTLCLFKNKIRKIIQTKRICNNILMLVICAIVITIINSCQCFNEKEKVVYVKSGNINYANSGTLNGVKYINKNDVVELDLKGIDNNYLSNSLTVSEIVVKVGGTVVTPTTKTLSEPTKISNGVQYKLTLSGITGNGELSIEISENTLKDKLNQQNKLTTFKSGIIVDNIAPTIDLTANVTSWTNQDITVNATYSDTNGIKSKLLTCTGTENTDYVVNGTTNVVVKENNKTVTASVIDIAGNKTVKTLTITNIDKIPPKEFNFYSTEIGGKDFTLTGKTTDDESGVQKYQYSNDKGVTWQDSNEFLELNVNTVYTLQMRAIDKAGNIRLTPAREERTCTANIRIRNITNTGFDILVWGRGYNDVSIAVWSKHIGQDDLLWYTGTKINSANEYAARVNVQYHAHGDTGGPYYVDAYAVNRTVFLEEALVFVPGNKYIDGRDGLTP